MTSAITFPREFIINPAGRARTAVVMDKIASLVATGQFGAAHRTWLQLRAGGDGSGKARIADAGLVQQGDAIFWHASTKESDVVYLRRPAPVLRSLEEVMNGR